MRITAGGGVGIGTPSPMGALDVRNGDAWLGTSASQLRVAYSTGSANYHGSHAWNGLQLGNNGVNYIVAGRTSAGGRLNFVVNNTTDFPTVNGTNAMTILANGNVGIGTSPGLRLDVAGDIRASGETWMSSATFYRLTSWMTCVAEGAYQGKTIALVTWPKDGACHTCQALCASAIGPNNTTGYTCMGGGYFGYSPTQNSSTQGSMGERLRWNDCSGNFGPGCPDGYGINASMGYYAAGGNDGTGTGHTCCCGL